jgi:transcriptional regulator with XRE-family HTH domain
MREPLRDVRLRVGRNVRRLRRLRGFSQERLAELAGNTSKHIGLVESGKVNVTIDILTAIAAGLSVNVGELFGPTPANPQRPRVFALTEREHAQIEQALRILRKIDRSARRSD